jgi:hypothetical protein
MVEKGHQPPPRPNKRQNGLLPGGDHDVANMLGQYWSISDRGCVVVNDDNRDKHLVVDSQGFGSPYFATVQESGNQVSWRDGMYVCVCGISVRERFGRSVFVACVMCCTILRVRFLSVSDP